MTEDELTAALVAGWNACRKSIYAVCEDIQERAIPANAGIPLRGLPTEGQARHAEGFYAGQKYIAKSIARGFNAMEAADDDNFIAARKALTIPSHGGPNG